MSTGGMVGVSNTSSVSCVSRVCESVSVVTVSYRGVWVVTDPGGKVVMMYACRTPARLAIRRISSWSSVVRPAALAVELQQIAVAI